jgi:murein DD-endopeptidase MepM/ murein hydrolase activator NlpD
VARFPLDTVSIASGYLDPRRNPPHYGVDAAGVAGAVVRAPERMVVLVALEASPDSADNTNTLPAPWVGYGPGVVVGKGASGRYHLLAHLGAVDVVRAQVVAEGEVVGALARHVGGSGPHVHWEVRDVAVDAGPATRAAHTVDPVAWLRDIRNVSAPSSLEVETPWKIIGLLALLWVVSRRA